MNRLSQWSSRGGGIYDDSVVVAQQMSGRYTFPRSVCVSYYFNIVYIIKINLSAFSYEDEKMKLSPAQSTRQL